MCTISINNDKPTAWDILLTHIASYKKLLITVCYHPIYSFVYTGSSHVNNSFGFTAKADFGLAACRVVLGRPASDQLQVSLGRPTLLDQAAIKCAQNEKTWLLMQSLLSCTLTSCVVWSEEYYEQYQELIMGQLIYY